jgi:hypothetical protein
VTSTLSPPETARAAADVAVPPAWRRAVELFASMKLTVVLLLCFGVLTFAGTLAQKDLGLFVAQRDFFESFYVVWDTGIALGSDRVLKVPLPGGYLLMLVLFANIVVGGLVRLRWRWRNAGILVTHLGIALLLLAGWVKLHFSIAGHVALFEGRQTASMVSFHDFELALVRRDGDRIVERTVPAADLAGARNRGTVTIADAALPFTIEVSHWLDNCRPQPKGPMFDVDVPVVDDGQGGLLYLHELPLQEERERNVSGCYVTVRPRGGEAQRSLLWGFDRRPWDDVQRPFTFEVQGQQWGLDLRRVTWDLPFTVRLDRFQKTDHPGTVSPRDYSSWISVLEPGGGERPVHIYMNHPLRRDGLVFYQTNWGPQVPRGMPPGGPPWYSVFEVARNPSDAWPKYASYVILAGLLLHFVGKLLRYLRSGEYRTTTPEMS